MRKEHLSKWLEAGRINFDDQLEAYLWLPICQLTNLRALKAARNNSHLPDLTHSCGATFVFFFWAKFRPSNCTPHSAGCRHKSRVPQFRGSLVWMNFKCSQSCSHLKNGWNIKDWCQIPAGLPFIGSGIKILNKKMEKHFKHFQNIKQDFTKSRSTRHPH